MRFLLLLALYVTSTLASEIGNHAPPASSTAGIVLHCSDGTSCDLAAPQGSVVLLYGDAHMRDTYRTLFAPELRRRQEAGTRFIWAQTPDQRIAPLSALPTCAIPGAAITSEQLAQLGWTKPQQPAFGVIHRDGRLMHLGGIDPRYAPVSLAISLALLQRVDDPIPDGKSPKVPDGIMEAIRNVKKRYQPTMPLNYIQIKPIIAAIHADAKVTAPERELILEMLSRRMVVASPLDTAEAGSEQSVIINGAGDSAKYLLAMALGGSPSGDSVWLGTPEQLRAAIATATQDAAACDALREALRRGYAHRYAELLATARSTESWKWESPNEPLRGWMKIGATCTAEQRSLMAMLLVEHLADLGQLSGFVSLSVDRIDTIANHAAWKP